MSSASPKRVLITTDTVGGVWQYTIELARALAELGIEPVVAALGEPPAQAWMETGGLPISFFDCRLEWMQDPWEDVARSGEWLIELARRTAPEIIHLNSYAHAALAWPAPVLVVGHSCVYSWYQAVKGRLPSARWHPYHQAVKAGLQAAQGVTAPTAAMLEQLRLHYGPFRALPPIPNGRRIAEFLPSRKKHQIISAGRLWDEAKNIAAVASIADRLRWPVMVAGAQQHPDGGRVEFKNVELLGVLTQQQFSACLSSSAIFALPAYYEPFGLSALEAGLAGCALVLGDIPSLREVWQDTAYFVPPQRTDLLREALDRLIEDESLRQRLARRARKRALGFTVPKMARGYLEVYGTLIRENAVRQS